MGGSCGYVHDDDLILVQPREGTFMTDQRSVSSMPGVTLTFVDADGPGDGLRNPVSTVTPSSSMVDFFSGASSPLLPQAQFRLEKQEPAVRAPAVHAARHHHQRQRFSVLFSETRSHGRFPAQLPLDGRGQLSWDEVRPRVAARRRDVEVLLPEGAGAGLGRRGPIVGPAARRSRAQGADSRRRPIILTLYELN